MGLFLLKCLVLSGMLLGLPLLGVKLAGLPVARYLEFPPETHYVTHAPFEWGAFTGYALFVLCVAAPFLWRGITAERHRGTKGGNRYPFPWWGWVGIATGLAAWIAAWTRFSWLSRFQPHTFTPLWLSYIVVINALTCRSQGRCMMVERPVYFLILFPVSTAFWWFFEYLNRFVQNWSYVGVRFGPGEYFIYATLSFSTVLPAVLGTRQWMRGFSWIEAGFGDFMPVSCPRARAVAWASLGLSGVGLACIGIWPNALFSLLWVSPFMIIVSLQSLMGESHILSQIAQGDWRPVVSSMTAALFCGVFWEMWNYFSLAKWEYAVPYVHRFQIFEMPVLGYAGYLPFGLECAVVGQMVDRPLHSSPPSGK